MKSLVARIVWLVRVVVVSAAAPMIVATVPTWFGASISIENALRPSPWSISALGFSLVAGLVFTFVRKGPSGEWRQYAVFGLSMVPIIGEALLSARMAAGLITPAALALCCWILVNGKPPTRWLATAWFIVRLSVMSLAALLATTLVLSWFGLFTAASTGLSYWTPLMVLSFAGTIAFINRRLKRETFRFDQLWVQPLLATVSVATPLLISFFTAGGGLMLASAAVPLLVAFIYALVFVPEAPPKQRWKREKGERNVHWKGNRKKRRK